MGDTKMPGERIVREKECLGRLSCGKTTFRKRFRDRLTRVQLGPYSAGFTESSLELLIGELVSEAANSTPITPRTNIRPRSKQTPKRRHRTEARAAS